MKYRNKVCQYVLNVLCISLLSCAQTLQTTQAAESSSNYASSPSTFSVQEPPLVMLAMSMDHQLFIKAYSDYSDLDGDGALDTTYDDSLTYYGYFNSDFCYYISSGVFIPHATDKPTNGHKCATAGAPWSGNFMNWATMTRIDVLRKVLYGGLRSTDLSTETVLKRATLPYDIHSFSKVYEGTDALNYTPHDSSASGAISLCSVTKTSGGDPYVRVATGSYERWAADENIQCQTGSSVSPSTTNDYIVKVKVCIDGIDSSSSGCHNYGTSASPLYKPIGLLQTYGGEGDIKFGLITGSHNKPRDGGVVRRDIGDISAEINADGTFDTSVQGIINTINNMGIIEYSYSSNLYEDCLWVKKSQLDTNSSRKCRNWGNPLAEIYLEALRYFAGKTSPTTAFNADDSSYGLSRVTSWSNPMTSATKCASCSIILLSAGLNSFDMDALSSLSDLPGLTNLSDLDTGYTDIIGNHEFDGSFAGNYISGGGSDDLCNSKSLTNLSQAEGICPELPQLEGGYDLAGLAYYGNMSDLRTTSGFDDQQSVRTFAVELAESLPSFAIPVGSGKVTFLPACESDSSGSYQGCTLTNIVVESQTKNGDDIVAGSLLITWEDSLWGSDHDLDAAQRLTFCVGSACSPAISDDQIKITNSMPYVRTGASIQVGYSLSGTDGTDGIASSSWLSSKSGNCHYDFLSSPPNYWNCTEWDKTDPAEIPPDVSATYTSGTTNAEVLEKPIWYATKWGGFVDVDGDQIPDTREWDNKNNLTGNPGSDGQPDNYFFANNPGDLENQMKTILEPIVNATASGTNAAVVANNNQGQGALYQVLYQPEITKDGDTITWGGLLHAVFIDECGYLREDNGNGKLEDYSTDKIITIFYDEVDKDTRVQRWSAVTVSGQTCPDITEDGDPLLLHQFTSIWSARDQLADLTDVVTQRTYATNANTGRYIFSFIDKNKDGLADSGETVTFDAATFSNATDAYYRYLEIPQTDAADIVNFIRGDESHNSYRNRTIDYDDDGTREKWILGDIVHSTPAVVGPPSENYYDVNGDVTYKDFRTQYINRRQMVYVGANDGMLHAFNGGVWDESNKAFNENGHELGTELWGYIPMNLLPHLRWLAETNYPHVYYVDGEPVAADVNIFTPDSTHPDGWGTILVVGMRMGGGTITADIDGDASNGEEQTFGSAFMILDITDPESPPELIAEFNTSGLGFTTAKPTIIRFRQASTDPSLGIDEAWKNPSVNQWYLAFGSGPDDLDNATSTGTAKLYLLDLNDLADGRAPASVLTTIDTSTSTSFTGDLAAIDWDQDGLHDNIYFGVVGGNAASATGGLKRLTLTWNSSLSTSLTDMISPALPISAAPAPVIFNRKPWVYVGTGRFFVSDDRSNAQDNYFYGLLENDSTLSASNLVDVTGVRAFGTDTSNATIQSSSGGSFSVDSTAIGTQSELRNVVEDHHGFKILMHNSTSPTGKVIRTATRGLFNSILFVEYVPPELSTCDPNGQSYLYAIDSLSGVTSGALGFDESVTDSGGNHLRNIYVDFGKGNVSAPVLHKGSGHTDTQATVIGVTSTGEVVQMLGEFLRDSSFRGRQSWREIRLH